MHQQGLILLQKGQGGEAVSLLQAAATAVPSPENLNDLAAAHLQCRQTAPALHVLQHTIEKFPKEQKPRCNLAKLLASLNRAEEGLAVLAAIPDAEMESESWISRALVLYKLARRAEAIPCLEAARQERPRGLPVRHMLAKCYNEEKQWEASLAVLAEAEAIAAQHPEAQLTLQHYLLKGWAAMHAEKPDMAISAFREALKMDPQNDIADEMLGQLHARLYQTESALRHYDQVSARHPQVARYHEGAAQALLTLQYYDQAIARLQTALQYAPESYSAARALAQALAVAGHREASKARFADLLAKHTNEPDAWIAKGDAQLICGDIAGAGESYRRAHALNPHIAVLYRRLADLPPRKEELEPLISRITEELTRTGLSTAELGDLHIALARLLDRAGQYDAAMEHFDTGNACIRRTVRYNEASTLVMMTRIREAFSAPLTETAEPPEKPGCPRPLFVVGMPRSGTSLIEQILASHSDIFGAGERADFTLLAQKHLPGDPLRWPEQPQQALQTIGADYMARLTPLAPDATWIVDKMPGNSMYAGLILKAIPDAKIIWVEREAMDCCFSCYQQIFAGNLPYTYDQAELGHYARAIHTLLTHWTGVLPQSRFLHIRYEDLLAEPEANMRRLIDFCGLGWQEQCLHFENTDRPVHTASASQVRKPLNKNTGGRWKPYAKGLARLQAALNGEDAA